LENERGRGRPPRSSPPRAATVRGSTAKGGALGLVAVAVELPSGREPPVGPPASALLARALAAVPLPLLRLAAEDGRMPNPAARLPAPPREAIARRRVEDWWLAARGFLVGAGDWRRQRERGRRRGVGFANRTPHRNPF
jgi:hypothetical protein